MCDPVRQLHTCGLGIAAQVSRATLCAIFSIYDVS